MIPVIIGGVALLAAAKGVKDHYDARSMSNNANKIVDEVNEKRQTALTNLDKARQVTSEQLEDLGKRKVQIMATTMHRFVDLYGRVRDVNSKLIVHGENLSIPSEKLSEWNHEFGAAMQLVDGGFRGLAAGALMGIGASSLAASIGTASTGTAIASLSGAAATNATLAWLGGGSLAAGGFGIAGGTALLGGVGAAPLILFTGMRARSVAEKKLTSATEYESDSSAEISNIEGVTIGLGLVQKRINEISEVISTLDKYMIASMNKAEAVFLMREMTKPSLWQRIALFFQRKKWNPMEYNNFSKKQKQVIEVMTVMGVNLHKLLKVPVMDESGCPSEESKKYVGQSNLIIESARG